MQISTGQFYSSNLTGMQSLTATADKLQTEIATTKKINAPSDNAVDWNRLQTLARAGADDTAYTGNLTLVGTTLSQADGTLSSITDALQQAKELAVKANSGTLSASDRSAIADQLDTIVNNLVSYANVKDSRGASIFASGDDPAVVKNADGTFSFSTAGPSAVPVGANESIQPGDSATRLFVDSSGNNILSQISALSAALRGTGDVSSVAGSTGDALQAANVVLTNHAPFTDGLATAKVFATYAAGQSIGTAKIAGTFGLDKVPSSVTPGLYTATVTLTAV